MYDACYCKVATEGMVKKMHSKREMLQVLRSKS